MEGYSFCRRILQVCVKTMRKTIVHYQWFQFCMLWLTNTMNRLSKRIHYVVTHPIPELKNLPGKSVGSSTTEMPVWVRDEILGLAEIEPELCTIEAFEFYAINTRPQPGKAYAEAWEKVGGQHFTHVLIVPWMVRGGADLGVLHHLTQIVSKNGTKVLLLTTENADSPWMGKVDPRVVILELGKICAYLDFDDIVVVLTRLILQLRPEVIHNVNSRVAWEMISRHGLAIRQVSKVYASLYCDDFTPDGVAVGYARAYLRKCAHHIEKIISDNSIFPAIWSRDFGISMEKFAVIYFPANHACKSAFAPRPSARRVLWAGRFTRQKNPGILAEIAKRTPDIQYDVYGTHEAGNIVFTENVTLKGAYDDFMNIPHEDYACYLNASLWDGLPNVLLEATVAGLPIVSTVVGGICDFLDAENAFLVDDSLDIDLFCQQIALAISDREASQQRWAKAIEVVETRHNFAAMQSALISIGYLKRKRS